MNFRFPGATAWRIRLMAYLARADQARPTVYSSRIDGLLLAE